MVTYTRDCRQHRLFRRMHCSRVHGRRRAEVQVGEKKEERKFRNGTCYIPRNTWLRVDCATSRSSVGSRWSASARARHVVTPVPCTGELNELNCLFSSVAIFARINETRNFAISVGRIGMQICTIDALLPSQMPAVWLLGKRKAVWIQNRNVQNAAIVYRSFAVT